jgi:hypothetical protein
MLWLILELLPLSSTDPVFLLSYCGLRPEVTDSSSTADGGYEREAESLGAVVEFARKNNLLGIIVPADLLVSLF